MLGSHRHSSSLTTSVPTTEYKGKNISIVNRTGKDVYFHGVSSNPHLPSSFDQFLFLSLTLEKWTMENAG